MNTIPLKREVTSSFARLEQNFMKGLFREVPGSPTLPAQVETFLSQPAPEGAEKVWKVELRTFFLWYIDSGKM